MKAVQRIVDGWTTPLLCGAVLLGCGLLAGCGGGSDKPRGNVTITVTNGGEPVTEGRVDLNNEQTGEAAGGELDSRGQVTLTGVAEGTYTVTVLPPEPPPLIPDQPAPEVKEYPHIPQQVRMINTSPLEAEVKGRSSEYTFDLQEL